MKKLKEAKNLRYKKIRVCATCKWCGGGDGAVKCEREGGIDEDANEMKHWIMVCDRWTSNAENTKADGANAGFASVVFSGER